MSQMRSDTSPEIAREVRERLNARSGVERIAMGSRMFDAARTLALASFPPGLPEVEIKIRLCERIYGGEVDLAGFADHLRAINGAEK